jgi:hypothetical protein
MIPIVLISLPTFRLVVKGATAAFVPIGRATGAGGIVGMVCIVASDTLGRAGAGDWARR